MRKQYKDKRTACALCKPHKRHWSNRWTAKERSLISRTDKEIKEAYHRREIEHESIL